MESEADIAYRLLIENSKKYKHSKFYKFISKADKISIKENKKITLPLFLVKTVISQQVSTSAAQSIWIRFQKILKDTKPKNLTKKDLHLAGISRQKSEYILKILENSVINSLSKEKLRRLSKDNLTNKLIKVKGIGPWSVGMTRMFFICDPDVWLEGDLGIKKSLKVFLPDIDRDQIKEIYSPSRTYLCFYLWKDLDSI